MNHSISVGLNFGLTSDIITTLGLMVGLSAGTQSELAVIGGILTIAIADAFSDALGIHVSEEGENKHTAREIWTATFSTFISKFIFAMTFVVPVLLFDLNEAVIISIVWGLTVLAIASYFLAKSQNTKAWNVVGEHLLIAIMVIIATNFIGQWINNFFQ